jgi:hypothetical protein
MSDFNHEFAVSVARGSARSGRPILLEYTAALAAYQMIRKPVANPVAGLFVQHFVLNFVVNLVANFVEAGFVS